MNFAEAPTEAAHAMATVGTTATVLASCGYQARTACRIWLTRDCYDGLEPSLVEHYPSSLRTTAVDK